MSQTKISDMTREELKASMTEGDWNRFDNDNKKWQRAFDLAKAAGHGNLDMDCNKCWEIVKRFLEQ